MKKLELGELYNREDVHKLFGGDSKFTPGLELGVSVVCFGLIKMI